MKLLVCSPEYPPESSGIGHVAYNIVEKLKKMGLECTVCSPSGPDIQIGNNYLMQKSGIIGLIYFWTLIAKYFSKNQSFDAVWLHHDVLFLMKNPFNKPLITLHTTYYGYSKNKIHPSFYYKIASKIERYLFKIINNCYFTGVSPEICNEVVNIGIDKNNVKYIPNGVDTNHFKPSKSKKSIREKFGIPKNDLVILSLGRLTAQKQPKKLIETFNFVEKKLENVTLAIAGDGELLKEIKKDVIKKQLKKVIFLGQLDYKKDVPNLYASSDCFIITSNYEGQPLTLLEAMSSGLPCIVSNISNLDIIKKANCGIVVNFDDPEKSAKKIIEYITGDLSLHSNNARKYSVENLDWDVISRMYLIEFKKIMER